MKSVMDLTLFGGGEVKFYLGNSDVLQCLDTFLFSSQCDDIVTGEETTIVYKTFFLQNFFLMLGYFSTNFVMKFQLVPTDLKGQGGQEFG